MKHTAIFEARVAVTYDSDADPSDPWDGTADKALLAYLDCNGPVERMFDLVSDELVHQVTDA